MKTIERILSSGKAFEISQIACMSHAESISGFSRPQEDFPWSSLSPEIQLTFKIAFISICHQINWDYLQSTLANKLLADKNSLLAKLCEISSRDIESWLGDYPKKERVRAKERARLLRNVGEVLREKYNSEPTQLYNAILGSRFDDGSYLSILEDFLAYRTDPLKKKAHVLSHDLFSEKIVKFNDPENIEPAVDYHIMRVYLRTGRVVPVDEAVYPFLKGDPNPRGYLIKDLRKQVSAALKLTAHYAGLSIPDINYIEWQIGRSICLNKNPACETIKSEAGEDIQRLCKKGCPHVTSCISYNEHRPFMEFEEPINKSADY